MDWLDHALRENPFIFGAIICVVTFVFRRFFSRSKPVSTATSLVGGVGFCMLAAFWAMRFWPPTLVQSKILFGIILACFLLGLMLSRLDSITFDTASREFVIEQSVLRSALTALFAGVGVALLTLFWDEVWGGHLALAAWCAWMAGGALGEWRRLVRAEGA